MRIHNAARRALANEFRASGLVADEEKAIPSLSWRDRKGEWHDSIMDISVRTVASPSHVLLDIVFVDANAKRNASRGLAASLTDAEQKKYKRHGPTVAPLAMTHRGRWAPSATAVLRAIACQACADHPDSPEPGRLLRRWRRRVAVAVMTAEAEMRIAALGGQLAAATLGYADAASGVHAAVRLPALLAA